MDNKKERLLYIYTHTKRNKTINSQTIRVRKRFVKNCSSNSQVNLILVLSCALRNRWVISMGRFSSLPSSQGFFSFFFFAVGARVSILSLNNEKERARESAEGGTRVHEGAKETPVGLKSASGVGAREGV